ncbi:MAG: trypsin-like peptidase domain-containing protein [Proteobacteria bacterium]|nr:trypsin-like peptidase domain-containing protein [Pseudomonadota bacterium]MBU1739319.1 trypsin-like peptidase domain-containing protein [Pseudomonadota bacterium]
MYSSKPQSFRDRVPTYLVWALCLFALWHIFVPDRLPVTDPDAVPRSVTPSGNLADDERNTISLFKNASPSVVYINSIELRRDFFSLNVYEIPRGTGSGFVWDHEGRIVTNFHVIGDAGRVEVTLADNSTWKASLVGAAPDRDLAVLQISAPPERLKPITVGDSETLQVGQKVFAIGNPFGLDQTITSGIVSALGREIKSVTGRTIQGVIQTDAAINPGNSGGPLLDSSGRLIGVNTMIYSPSGGSAGIGFAVPVESVNRVVPQIIRHGKVIRPGLGVTLASREIHDRLGIKGVLIISVSKGGAADRAGLRGTRKSWGDIILGDIIIAVDTHQVSDYDELRNVLDNYRVGDQITVVVIRDQKKLELQLTLEEVG